MFLEQRHYQNGSKSIKVLVWGKKIVENKIYIIRDPRPKVIKKRKNSGKLLKCVVPV